MKRGTLVFESRNLISSSCRLSAWNLVGQVDISVRQKNELNARLGAIRKAFDKKGKNKDVTAKKEALEKILQHFKEDENWGAYLAVPDVKGNILQNDILQGKKTWQSCLCL